MSADVLSPSSGLVKHEGIALDELFADDIKPVLPSSAATLATMSDLSNPWVMLTFWRRLFPFRQLFLWLNQNPVPTKSFTHREFAFTLQNEAYIRYQSFANADDFKKALTAQNPARFEIGPVYTGRPKDKKTLLQSNFKPVQRELVFDIDMTDYDAIRTCCQDKAMCRKCWAFIAMAVDVIERALRDDFGFEHTLWVYSGRRGIHCWVSDPKALNMTDDQRKAMINYFEVIKGGAQVDKKVNLPRPLHPSIQRAYEKTLKTGFAKIVLGEQNCFQQPEQWDSVLRMLPDKEHANKLSLAFKNKPQANSSERWQAILKAPPNANSLVERKYKDAIVDIVLQYTYPRMDIDVSKKLNHLLKSPFCIHPKTGRVCVPLLPEQVNDFDPDQVPTVGMLLMELEEASRLGDDKAGWEKTSLKPYIQVFENYVQNLVKANKGVVKKEEEIDPIVLMEF